MALGLREIARRSDGRIELRAEALRLRIKLDDLVSSDSHRITAIFSAGVMAVNTSADRQMLAEAFLADRHSVTTDDVTSHFLPVFREALSRSARERTADEWLSGDHEIDLIEAARAAARPVAFNSGVELLPPFELTLESPTVQREQTESMHRRLVERRAAGQAEHVQRSAELLRQFQLLRDAAPGLSPGRLLEQVSPADRGSMLESLLLASGGETPRKLYAVAGNNLVQIDPRATPAQAVLIPLTANLGPLRSIRAGDIDGEPVLLIGAQTGVLIVKPQKPSEARQFICPDTNSAMGFNSVVVASGRVYATHGEAGLVIWDIGQPESPVETIRPTIADTGPRNLIELCDSRIAYTIAGALIIKERDSAAAAEASTAAANIVHASSNNDHVVIVRSDGTVETLDPINLSRKAIERRCGDVSAVGVLPWLGTSRLLAAASDGPISCFGMDDSVMTQYASAHRGLRALAAAADVVAAISGDRQRIVLWKSWDGRQPAGEIHIANLTRHRAADLCFM